MNQKKMCLESFDEDSFGALVSGLVNAGYVIDGQDIQDMVFSSTQIEHMDQEIFEKLCARFNVSSVVEIGTAGNYFEMQGAFYIVYDKRIYDYQSAQELLAKYVEKLPQY